MSAIRLHQNRAHQGVLDFEAAACAMRCDQGGWCPCVGTECPSCPRRDAVALAAELDRRGVAILWRDGRVVLKGYAEREDLRDDIRRLKPELLAWAQASAEADSVARCAVLDRTIRVAPDGDYTLLELARLAGVTAEHAQLIDEVKRVFDGRIQGAEHE